MPARAPLRLAIRAHPRAAARPAWPRTYSTKPEDPLHPNPEVKAQTDATPRKPGDQLPHITEETAAMNKIRGQPGPEPYEGTPVHEVVADDEAALKHLPKVMRDAILKQQKQNQNQQKRSFSTLSRRLSPSLTASSADGGPKAMPASMISPEGLSTAMQRTFSQLEDPRVGVSPAVAALIAAGRMPDPLDARDAAEIRDRPALKFEYPTGPIPRLPREANRRTTRSGRRNDTDVVTQITNLIMRHGKKSQAQRHMAEILTHIRTSPAPRLNPTRPLLPDPTTGVSALPNRLPLDPALYVTLAIDSVAPLLRIKSLRGAAGGGAALPIPIPLSVRQRRRTAIMWLLEAANRRQGGTSGFAKRVAEELVSVVEGRSGVWEKRSAVHRLATGARSNLVAGGARRGRK